jgi:hypothetical protein
LIKAIFSRGSPYPSIERWCNFSSRIALKTLNNTIGIGGQRDMGKKSAFTVQRRLRSLGLPPSSDLRIQGCGFLRCLEEWMDRLAHSMYKDSGVFEERPCPFAALR